MFKKIVCPVDLSERAFKALPTVVRMAESFQAKLVILHIVETFMSEQEMIMLRVSPEHYQETQKKKALSVKETIEQRLKNLGIDFENIEIILREGSCKRDIAPICEKLGADLIVITTTGRDHLLENILGSTAEVILRHAKTSVLTVYVGKDEE